MSIEDRDVLITGDLATNEATLTVQFGKKWRCISCSCSRMSLWMVSFRVFFAATWLLLLASASVGLAADYKPGSLRKPADLPASRLRAQIEKLPMQAQARAVAWLGN